MHMCYHFCTNETILGTDIGLQQSLWFPLLNCLVLDKREMNWVEMEARTLRSNVILKQDKSENTKV